MLNKVKKQIEQFHMLDSGDRVLVGLSGGADSICLLQVLFCLREEYGIEIGAVHCHHGIRGQEADEDAEFAETFCRERGIAYHYRKETVETRAKENKLTVEEAGRQFRYETFLGLMGEYHYQKLAVAHNANDRAETMLFHLARGTGLPGLAAMEPVRLLAKDRILIRPLLNVERRHIESWLAKNALSWRTDRTNLSDEYTRNRIRHHILPELSQINSQAVPHMGKTAENVSEVLNYLRYQEEKARKEVLFEDIINENTDGISTYTKEKQQTEETDGAAGNKPGQELMIRADRLKSLHPYLQKSLLYSFLADITGSQKDISSIHVELLKELLDGESGRELTLARGIRARKEYNRLILFQKPEDVIANSTKLPEIEVKMERFSFSGQEISKNQYTKFFDCDKIEKKLCLRFRQPGDYLYLRENGGKKKLNRYFIDEKIPSKERDRIPLLADGNHILWIVGYRISAYYKVTEMTKEILSVTIKQKIEKEKTHGR